MGNAGLHGTIAIGYHRAVSNSSFRLPNARGEATEGTMALTDKQEAFVREYLVDLSPADAYLRAGYQVASREVAWKASNRLLKNVEVLRAIDEAQCARMERLELDADWVVARFRMVYLEAKRDRDYSAALKALDHIAKYLGLYERDNKQRRQYTDAERMRAELTKRGFDFAQELPGARATRAGPTRPRRRERGRRLILGATPGVHVERVITRRG
jgi:hypothetical protein